MYIYCKCICGTVSDMNQLTQKAVIIPDTFNLFVVSVGQENYCQTSFLKSWQHDLLTQSFSNI